MKKEFKYYPEDFGDLTVKVKHMDLTFDVFEDHTIVHSNLNVKTLKPIKELTLNAKNLEIKKVEGEQVASHNYKKDEDILIITFKEEIKPNTDITITTESICKPTKHILEGIYYDETPKGCPCTQITQCQQWGFQRIVPCIDDMTAKCTYSTTIIADKCYTNMITNGDLVEERTDVGNNREKIKYDNTVTPMATYLFFLGVGTYATFTKEFEYPDGKTFTLELLVPPESKKDIAEKALQILNDGIMWIYIFTGPECYDEVDKRKKLYNLTIKRDLLKKEKETEELKEIRKEIKALAEELPSFGYKYTGTVYREIGMQNSDFGGMENVGNTTITTNRIMPFEHMTDPSFEYMIRVKVHEFYHNLNGSEVTGRSPFEIWLNEAVTVHIEREHHSFLFGKDYGRLSEVLSLLGQSGTLARDASAASMPIEPNGFNDPNELITGITYVKAPEFVRMMQTLMGDKAFVKGLHTYHSKFKHSNASRAQWVEAMEGVAKKDFKGMAQQWLKQVKYPTIYVKTAHNEETKEYIIKIKQTTNEVWSFPFTVAIVDKKGKDIAEKTVWVKEKEEEIIFKNVQKPAFASLSRGFTFFGKVKHRATDEELYLQAEKDSDIINRYMAFYHLADKEKHKIIKGKKGDVSKKFIRLFFKLLSDERLMKNVSAQFVAIFESVEDKKFAHHYGKLYKAKKKITKAIAQKHKEALIELYEKYKYKKSDAPYVEQQVFNIKTRQVKNLCLALLAKLDTKDIHAMIKEQFNNPTCASDKIIAFSLYINSKAKDKNELIKEYEKEAKQHLVSWETFLAVIAGNDSDDAIEIMKRIEKSDAFRIEQANDQRALFCRFAGNKKKSLLTEEGRAYLQESMIKLAKINEYSTGHMLTVFGNVDQMEEHYHVPLIQILVNLLKNISQKDEPSVFNTTKRILAGNPKAVKAFEKENGKISY